MRCVVSNSHPPLVFIGGNQGASVSKEAWGTQNRLLQPIRDQHVEAWDEQPHWSVGQPRWSADRHVAPTASSFYCEVATWSIMSVLDEWELARVCFLPWRAHGSSRLHLIGLEDVASD